MRFRAHPAMLRKEARVMAMVPDKYLDLLQQKKAFANLATVNPDGTPQVTPVWFDYTDGVVRVNTARGRVRHVTEDGAVSHIDSLAKKYLGQDKYTNAQPGEVRLMCEIEPTSASGMG